MKKKLTFQEKLQKLSKNNKKSNGKYVLAGLVICILFIAGYKVVSPPDIADNEEIADSEFSASFVGDVMLGRNIEEITNKHGYSYLFENVSPIFDNADYVSGNLENSVLQSKEDNYQLTDELEDKPIHLHTNTNAVKALKNAHFSTVNLANNHLIDYGIQGLNETIDSLDKAGLNHVGAGKDEDESLDVDYQSFNGLTVATLGFTDKPNYGLNASGNSGGTAQATPQNIFPQIQEANKNADLVLVNIHWGVEYDNKPQPRQKELGRSMIDAGADAIIGHHSHVLSQVEKYHNGMIFYGLGNFVFDQGWSRTKDSVVVKYDLMENGTGRFEILPTRIREGQPYITNNKYHQVKINKQLTQDQPANSFEKEDGRLIFKVNHSNKLDKRG